MASYLDQHSLAVIRDWVRGRSLRVQETTQEAYDAMTDEEKQASETLWVIPDSTASGGESSGGADIPSGVIVMWSGAEADIPDGWRLCDGLMGTPDLRGRFVLGAGENRDNGVKYEVYATGGETKVTLTEAQMPRHRHLYGAPKITEKFSQSQLNQYAHSGSTQEGYTEYAGGGSAHNNMPPYYVLCYIMKL